jgi:methylmalonyl-CoA decarboxylase subunit alpha
VTDAERVREHADRALQGNLAKEGEKLARQNKLFVRERVRRLLDPDSFVEDGLLANALAGDLPADGVVTGVGRIDGRPVCVMANDPTVKAGSWGARTVEKIVRITEHALRHELPVVYLVDSGGARITDQVELFPGRRGAGRIFANQVRLSGKVPQVCCLFGPSAAGGAYIPAFCDVVFMVEGNASMYLGSPRMAEVVIGEKVSLDEMGGARIHATVSGCGDNLCGSDEEAIDAARQFLSYLPTNWLQNAPAADAVVPVATARAIADVVPAEERRAYDMHKVIDALVDADSFFELKPLWARELIVGFARIDGMPVGIVANNPMHLGGVLFVDSADKAARFIWLCDAFNVPLVFLADVPGFMIGSQVEREGIIRHGAKMITAVTEATVPKFSVIVRKAYGAGLYAMCGPAFDPDACLALPTAQIAVMGPEPAVNAVFYNRIQAIENEDERAEFVAARRREYEEDVDLVHLAAELVVDAVVQPEDLRTELSTRLALAAGRVLRTSASATASRPCESFLRQMATLCVADCRKNGYLLVTESGRAARRCSNSATIVGIVMRFRTGTGAAASVK